MKLVLLGTGGPEHHAGRTSQSSLLVTSTHKVLVDAGRGATNRLGDLGVEIAGIDRILVTHHHYDHIGDLGVLLASSWAEGRLEPLRVVGPPGTATIVSALFDTVYAPDIRWRQAEQAAWQAMADDPSGWEMRDPAGFVETTEIVTGEVERGEDLAITAAESEHGRTYLRLADWHSVAYRVEAEGRSVVFSGDSAMTEPLVELARGADVLVLNCYTSESQVTSPWSRVFSRTMIASSGECGRIAAAAGVGRLVLSHFGSGIALGNVEGEVREHYAGPVVLGHDLMELEV